jgi:hypothetical protein
MLTIKVWGLPERTENALQELHKSIVAAVASVRELNVRHESEMMVFFPTDRMAYGLGKEIAVEITNVPTKPRDMLSLQAVAVVIGKTVNKFFPGATVECSAQPFKLFDCCLWSSKY